MFRRNFIKKMSVAGLTYGLTGIIPRAPSPFSKRKRYVVNNPYQEINWQTVQFIPSTSHIHIINQQGLDKAYELGYRHLPISNYYPSTPYYPLKEIRENQFKVKQDFGIMHLPNKGIPHFVEGPIFWNNRIMDPETGWYDSLSKERQDELPFKEGDYIFKNIPKDIIFSPNAEHHSFVDTKSSVHINSLGSFYSSGSFDAHNRFSTFWGGGEYSFGTGLPWKEAFKKMLAQLQFEDAGGITINHPTWSQLDPSIIEEMLDFDPRVLGIEIFEECRWSIDIWDNILSTGRRCLGFCVPDWGVQETKRYRGFNFLLVDDNTEHACLKAYREGSFFGSEYGKLLRFSEITLINNRLKIKTNTPATVTFISDGRIIKQEANTKESVCYIPFDKNDVPSVKYIRVEATDKSNERILSQPIRFIKQY